MQDDGGRESIILVDLKWPRETIEMKTKITGFHQEEDAHWVAGLSCGHSRYFKHDPPWQG